MARSATGLPDVLEGNVFAGNGQAGVQLDAGAMADLGGGAANSRGGNIFLNNGKADLVNNSAMKISAKNNLWSGSSEAEILGKFVAGAAGAEVMPLASLSPDFYAQFVELAGYTSTATMTNPSRGEGAAALLAVRNGAGAPAPVRLEGNAAAGGLHTTAVAPLGSQSLSTDPSTTQVNVGSMAVLTPRTLAGTVLFSSPAAGVAGVGRSELLREFIAPIERNLSKDINSGVAIASPNQNPMSVQLTLRDKFGFTRQKTLNFAGFGQTAQFISELFGDIPSEFSGVLIVKAPADIAATVLRASPRQFATLPVTGAGSKRLLFAQFAEVVGIGSTLTAVNPSTTQTVQVTARIFDDNGAKLAATFNGVERPGEFSFTLGPQEAATFATPGTSSVAKVGSVILEATDPIGGTIVFWGASGLAGVGASQEVSDFVAPVEQSATGNVSTALALANAGVGEVSVKLTLRDQSGTELATVQIVLKGQGHAAKFIDQFFAAAGLDLTNFRGTVTAEVTGGKIGATVLRFSSVPQEIATLPVAQLVP